MRIRSILGIATLGAFLGTACAEKPGTKPDDGKDGKDAKDAKDAKDGKDGKDRTKPKPPAKVAEPK